VVFMPGKAYGLGLYQKIGHALDTQCRGPLLAPLGNNNNNSIEYSSLRDFYRPLGNNNNNRSILIWGFLKDDILACVETWN
jgi:hypothetical protein